MDHQDLALTNAWDLDVPFVLERADSMSELPTFQDLLTALQDTPERETPPLVASSSALLEDGGGDKASLLLHLHLGRPSELDVPLIGIGA